MQWHCFSSHKTFSTLYGTPISIYFSNNYFTIVTMQDYFGVLSVCVRVCIYIIWQGKKVQAQPKSYTNIFIIMEVMAFIEMYWSDEITC